MNQLYGALITFEMREFDKDAPKREATFKVSKRVEDEVIDQVDEFDEAEANFVGRLKKDIDKCKGKLPFTYFNCGRIGHFASKCTFRESIDSSKRDKFKRSLYSKENNCSSKDEDHDYSANENSSWP